MCPAHIQRKRRKLPMDVPIGELHKVEFGERLDKSFGPGACWLWTGWADKHGYGRLSYQGRMISAHRLAWTLARGPIQACVIVKETGEELRRGPITDAERQEPLLLRARGD